MSPGWISSLKTSEAWAMPFLDPEPADASMLVAAPVLRLRAGWDVGQPSEFTNLLKNMIAEHKEQHRLEMETLTRWREALDKRQELLDQREEKLRQREAAVSKAKPRDSKSRGISLWNARVPCDYCSTFYCTRGPACIGENGEVLHRHHNCANCHNAWKKGQGKGLRVPGA